MTRRARIALTAAICFWITAAAGAFAAEPGDQARSFGDFSWMHGLNYTPSYAATDVETWLKYDREVIDREFDYAQQLGLNCVRVFLQSAVWEHEPERFLANFEDFLALADQHGLRVMPILFDSCFGVSPSLESSHIWVANPGPDRMTPEHFPAMDAYAKAVVTPHIDDERVALWDVMNEPTATPLAATPEGRAQIMAFLEHYCGLVRRMDPSHAVTVGVAGADNTGVVDWVDVLSCHSYAPTLEKFQEALRVTRDQAVAAGKPWIISECCAPGWGSQYEMVFPVLRELGVGHTAWELVIGRNQFAPISGLFYPDGSVRRLAQIEAVVGGPAPQGIAEKPDSQGVAIANQKVGLVAEYVRFAARNAVTEDTWRERTTLVAAAVWRKHYGEQGEAVSKELEAAKAAYAEGEKKQAFQAVEALLKRAADILGGAERPAGGPGS